MALSKANQAVVALRHTAAVLLGAALRDLFPTIQRIQAKATSLGFAYEVCTDVPLDDHALTLLEERMRVLIGKGLAIKSREMVRQNAMEYFRYHQEELKAGILAEEESTLLSLQQIDDYLDVVPTPHCSDLREVKAFTLLSMKRGVRTLSHGEQLQTVTISGTVLPDNKALKNFIKQIRAGANRDHQKIGTVMRLFTLPTADICLWYPHGTVLRELILNWWKSQLPELGAEMVSTTGLPSGSSRAQRHAMLFAQDQHTYDELPLGYAEVSEVNETTTVGDQSGLMTLPLNTAAETHLFCRTEQLSLCLSRGLDLMISACKTFGLEARVYLSHGHAGVVAERRRVVESLTSLLVEKGIDHFVDEDDDHALDGPRVDFRVIDSFRREWISSSLSILLGMERAVSLRYQEASGRMQRPAVIALRIFGSLERWIGLLLEQCVGEIPFWLAPEQVRIIPVSATHLDYAKEVRNILKASGWRTAIDGSDGRLGAKIFAAEQAKVPLSCIVGDEETVRKTVMVRRRLEGQHGQTLTLNEFLATLGQEGTGLNSKPFKSRNQD